MSHQKVTILIEIQGKGEICLFVGPYIIRTWRLKYTHPDGTPLELARHIQTALLAVNVESEIENIAGEIKG